MGKTYMAHCQSGYYCYDRKVHVGKPLRDHVYAQCGWNRIVDTENDKMIIQFVSYETIVVEIVGKNSTAQCDWLHCYGTFSNTTRKQIGWFMREMKERYGYREELCTYQTCKHCYEKDIEINLMTGETRKASQGMIQTVGVRVNTDW